MLSSITSLFGVSSSPEQRPRGQSQGLSQEDNESPVRSGGGGGSGRPPAGTPKSRRASGAPATGAAVVEYKDEATPVLLDTDSSRDDMSDDEQDAFYTPDAILSRRHEHISGNETAQRLAGAGWSLDDAHVLAQLLNKHRFKPRRLRALVREVRFRIPQVFAPHEQDAHPHAHEGGAAAAAGRVATRASTAAAAVGEEGKAGVTAEPVDAKSLKLVVAGAPVAGSAAAAAAAGAGTGDAAVDEGTRVGAARGSSAALAGATGDAEADDVVRTPRPVNGYTAHFPTVALVPDGLVTHGGSLLEDDEAPTEETLASPTQRLHHAHLTREGQAARMRVEVLNALFRGAKFVRVGLTRFRSMPLRLSRDLRFIYWPSHSSFGRKPASTLPPRSSEPAEEEAEPEFDGPLADSELCDSSNPRVRRLYSMFYRTPSDGEVEGLEDKAYKRFRRIPIEAITSITTLVDQSSRFNDMRGKLPLTYGFSIHYEFPEAVEELPQVLRDPAPQARAGAHPLQHASALSLASPMAASVTASAAGATSSSTSTSSSSHGSAPASASSSHHAGPVPHAHTTSHAHAHAQPSNAFAAASLAQHQQDDPQSQKPAGTRSASASARHAPASATAASAAAAAAATGPAAGVATGAAAGGRSNSPDTSVTASITAMTGLVPVDVASASGSSPTASTGTGTLAATTGSEMMPHQRPVKLRVIRKSLDLIALDGNEFVIWLRALAAIRHKYETSLPELVASITSLVLWVTVERRWPSILYLIDAESSYPVERTFDTLDLLASASDTAGPVTVAPGELKEMAANITLEYKSNGVSSRLTGILFVAMSLPLIPFLLCLLSPSHFRSLSPPQRCCPSRRCGCSSRSCPRWPAHSSAGASPTSSRRTASTETCSSAASPGITIPFLSSRTTTAWSSVGSALRSGPRRRAISVTGRRL